MEKQENVIDHEDVSGSRPAHRGGDSSCLCLQRWCPKLSITQWLMLSFVVIGAIGGLTSYFIISMLNRPDPEFCSMFCLREDCNDCEVVEGYPECFIFPVSYESRLIGNGVCDAWTNVSECGYDGGDCIPTHVNDYSSCILLPQYHGSVGDGNCDDTYPFNGVPESGWNTSKCGYDGGDCTPTLVDGYSDCFILPQYHGDVGDGTCDQIYYFRGQSQDLNTTYCDYDGGDCIPTPVEGYPDCIILPQYHGNVGDGKCDDDEYNSWRRGWKDLNTTECDYDGGDCIPFSS